VISNVLAGTAFSLTEEDVLTWCMLRAIPPYFCGMLMTGVITGFWAAARARA
jgi:hypothetical protein